MRVYSREFIYCDNYYDISTLNNNGNQNQETNNMAQRARRNLAASEN